MVGSSSYIIEGCLLLNFCVIKKYISLTRLSVLSVCVQAPFNHYACKNVHSFYPLLANYLLIGKLNQHYHELF